MPFRVIPDLVEILKDQGKSLRAKGGNIFDDGVLRFDFFDEPAELTPES